MLQLIKVVSFLFLTLNVFTNGEIEQYCLTTDSQDNFFEEIFGFSTNLVMLIENNLKLHPNNYDSIRFITYSTNGKTSYISSENASQLLDFSLPTKIIIPGWQSNTTLDWITNLAETYFSETPTNIIIMDWSEINQNNYILACAIPVPRIGEILANFIIDIQKKSNQTFVQNCDLIGHSCGAHIAGVAGRQIQSKIGLNLWRIVGLDAAGPCFDENLFFCPALKASDASTVQGFFTNPGFFGTRKPYARLNVLFNGICQPNCVENNNFLHSARCSHFQSCFLWIDSIKNPSKYMAQTCNSTSSFTKCGGEASTQVGDHADPNTSGNYYSTATTETHNY